MSDLSKGVSLNARVALLWFLAVLLSCPAFPQGEAGDNEGVTLAVELPPIDRENANDSGDEETIEKPLPKPSPTPKSKSKRNLGKELKRQIDKVERAQTKAAEETKAMRKQLTELRDLLDRQTKSLEEISSAMEGQRTKLGALENAEEKNRTTQAEREKTAESLRLNVKSMGKLIDVTGKEVARLEGQLGKFAEADETISTDLEKQRGMMQILRGDLNNNDEDIAGLRRQAQRMEFQKSKKAGKNQGWDMLKHPGFMLGVGIVSLAALIFAMGK